MDKCFIYVIKDPRTDQVRYVGQTSTGENRFKVHLKPSSLRRKLRVANWIKSLKMAGVEPKFEILEICPKDQLDKREIFHIQHFKTIGCDLVNHSTGGHGTRGAIPSDETRAKISRGGKGRKLSEETKKKMSESRKGMKYKPQSDEIRARKSEYRRGKKHSEETKAKIAAGNTGKIFSEERKSNISKALKKKDEADGKTIS